MWENRQEEETSIRVSGNIPFYIAHILITLKTLNQSEVYYFNQRI